MLPPRTVLSASVLEPRASPTLRFRGVGSARRRAEISRSLPKRADHLVPLQTVTTETVEGSSPVHRVRMPRCLPCGDRHELGSFFDGCTAGRAECGAPTHAPRDSGGLGVKGRLDSRNRTVGGFAVDSISPYAAAFSAGRRSMGAWIRTGSGCGGFPSLMDDAFLAKIAIGSDKKPRPLPLVTLTPDDAGRPLAERKRNVRARTLDRAAEPSSPRRR